MPAVAVATPATPSPADLKAGVAADKLFVADKAARTTAAQGIVALAQKDGPSAIKSNDFIAASIKALGDKKSPAAREGAAQAVAALAKDAPKSIEPFFIDSGLYAALLEAFADKLPKHCRASIP